MTSVRINSNIVLAILLRVYSHSSVLTKTHWHNETLDYYNEKLEAAKLAKKAEQCIKDYRLNHGVFIDAVCDPNETGLIGQDITPITTDHGYIDA